MKVLLCEDEKSLAKALATMLTINKFDVQIAIDGEIASNFLQKSNYDIVIMDIMMPKKDGITLLTELRKSNNFVPVIMLTAKSEVEDKVNGLESGANDYLTKPFAFKELLARIHVLTKSTYNAVLTFGDIQLDKSNNELKSTCGTLRLANQEFEMLEMLINIPNGNIDTARFFDKIWHDAKDIDSSIVEIYISYLQKKLDLLGSNFTIVKDSTLGYCLGKK